MHIYLNLYKLIKHKFYNFTACCRKSKNTEEPAHFLSAYIGLLNLLSIALISSLFLHTIHTVSIACSAFFLTRIFFTCLKN